MLADENVLKLKSIISVGRCESLEGVNSGESPIKELVDEKSKWVKVDQTFSWRKV